MSALSATGDGPDVSDSELVARTEQLIDVADPTDQFAFRGAQYDAGLAWVHFPVGKGGLGLDPGRQVLVTRTLRSMGVDYHDLYINPMGYGMAAPTLIACGSETLQLRHLRPIFTGEEMWCQLFSEPTHGSDLAGIASRAVSDGDEWSVNGQKVWTSLAHVARFGLLLARTDPSVAKHRGLSYFVLDMAAPGVEVRPLFDLTGEADFNEVFLTNVRIPDDHMLGAEGDGWRVATTTLMNERVALGGDTTIQRGQGPISDLLDVWAARRDLLPASQRAVWRDRVVSLWTRAEALRLTTQRANAARASAGPEGSISKLMSAELRQEIYRACVDLQGAQSLLHECGYSLVRRDEVDLGGPLTTHFLRTRANTIEGGTSEVMRNILGERVLGLPGDIRVDTNLPWSEIPR